MSDLLGVPMENFESLEFLRYGPGQHYKEHQDTEDVLESRQVGSGMRVLTVFLYLSDVEDGGATLFPRARLKVHPKKGKIVVWANVQSNFWKSTGMAQHAAEPVNRGLKVAANFWVHPLDFRTAEHFAPETC